MLPSQKKSSKHSSFNKCLGNVTTIVGLVIIFCLHLTWQITKYLDRPCLNNMSEEKNCDACMVCSKRMEEGSRSEKYIVTKLYGQGYGVGKDCAKYGVFIGN